MCGVRGQYCNAILIGAEPLADFAHRREKVINAVHSAAPELLDRFNQSVARVEINRVAMNG